MGLEKPLFELRNPGLISIRWIPGSDPRLAGCIATSGRGSVDEVYVRQTTGILATRRGALTCCPEKRKAPFAGLFLPG